MEQVFEAIKFLLFYGLQAFAVGLVVGIGVIATLYQVVRDKIQARRAATLEAAGELVEHS